MMPSKRRGAPTTFGTETFAATCFDLLVITREIDRALVHFPASWREIAADRMTMTRATGRSVVRSRKATARHGGSAG
jgi:hypothetical protein